MSLQWKNTSGNRGDSYGNGLIIPNRSEFRFGTGDFTLEYFMKTPNPGQSRSLAFGRYSLETFSMSWENGCQVWLGGSDAIRTSLRTASNGSVDLSQWHHYAVSRKSGTLRLFVDGVVQAAVSNSYNFTDACNNFFIGGEYISSFPSVTPFIGSMSNIRFVVGTALYDSAFTPPTTALTNVPGTVLLLSMNSDATKAVDSSPLNNNITFVGGTSPNNLVWSSDKPLADSPPGAPTAVTAIPGASSTITVSWTAPVNTGTTPITSYTVTSSSGSSIVLADSSETSVTFTGLSAYTGYTFTVYATNSIGNSPNASSGTVAIGSVPSVPKITTGSISGTTLSLGWNPSSGTAITGYTISVPSDNLTKTVAANVTSTTLTLSSAVTSAIVRIYATNIVGNSNSASGLVSTTGVTFPPGAPTNVRVTPASGAIDVSWNVPADVGSGVSSYTITATPTNAGYTTKTVTIPAPLTTGKITGLTNGVAYTVSVSAVTPGGITGASATAATNSTPTGTSPPAGPTISSAALSGSTVTVVWSSVATATKYTVLLVSSAGTTTTVTTQNTTYTFSGVDATKTYVAKVFASNSGGDSLAVSASVSMPWAALSDPSLAFYLTFDNDNSSASTLKDLSPHSRDFTRNAGSIVDVAGRKCFSIAQTGSVGPTLTPTGLTNITNITYLFWIYLTQNANEYDAVIFSRGNGTSATGIHLAGTNVRHHWQDNYYSSPTDLSLTLNTWQHVAVVITPTQSRWYLNGSLAYTRNQNYSTITSLGNFFIGFDTDLTRSMPGYLDDCAVFMRALTVDEINKIYSNGSAATADATTIQPPSNVLATAGNTQVTVSWTAPSNVSEASISSYTVTATPGGASVTTADGATKTATVTGLTNGTKYTFTVTASTATETSVPSTPSLEVSPFPPQITAAVTNTETFTAFIEAQPVATQEEKKTVVVNAREAIKNTTFADQNEAADAKLAYIEAMRAVLETPVVTIPPTDFESFKSTMVAVKPDLVPKPVEVIYPKFVEKVANIDVSTVTDSVYNQFEVPIGYTIVLQNGADYISLLYTGSSYISTTGTVYNVGDTIVVGGKTIEIVMMGSVGLQEYNNGGGGGGAVCFLGNAPVLTPAGYRRIDSLAVGDLVRTADGRDVAIRRVKHQRVLTPSVAVNPYVIPKGKWGATENVAISPRHCIAVPGRGMVEARELGLRQMTMRATFDYYNLELPEWDNMVVAGVEVESMAPTKKVVLTAAQFRELVGSSVDLAKLAQIARVREDGLVDLVLTRKARRAV